MHVCMCVNVYIYMYVYICIYVCTCVCTCVCMHIYLLNALSKGKLNLADNYWEVYWWGLMVRIIGFSALEGFP